MRLAPRLVLISLVTGVLPWAGCQYLRDVEGALRQGQADTLAATTTAIAGLVESRPERFLIDPGRFAPARTIAEDLYAHPLIRPPVLDGYGNDWGLPETAWRFRPRSAGPAMRYVAGEAGGFIHLVIEVEDDQVVYGEPNRADAVLLRLGDPLAGGHEFVFATEAPGLIRPRGGALAARSRVEANWQPTSSGYSLEIRMPLSLTMDRLGFLVYDRDGDPPGTTAGSLEQPDAEPGWLIWRRRAIDRDLARAISPGTRVRLLDPAGFVLADAGVASRPVGIGANALQRRLLRMALGDRAPSAGPPASRPGWLNPKALAGVGDTETSVFRYRSEAADHVIVLAARALPVAAGIDGLLVAEQDADAILSLTDRAAFRLFGASFIVGVIAAVLLLGFAIWLSLRIRRLSAAARRGLARGEAPTVLPEAASQDELGDLSRSFSRLLTQVRDYNLYLQSLGGKLTHELRTPMAVVRTSLENLRAEPSGPQAERYLARAQEGIERLQQMVSALGAATRMEEAIAAADDERFDLVGLVSELGAAYAATGPEPAIDCDVPPAPCEVLGSPELIAQACDKLIENARDFCPADGRITLALETTSAHARISVSNTGSRLPEAVAEELFDSLVSHREGEGTEPHLGLGLYIVRLIADHHRATVAAHNLPDGSGVMFELILPRAD